MSLILSSGKNVQICDEKQMNKHLPVIINLQNKIYKSRQKIFELCTSGHLEEKRMKCYVLNRI